MNFKSLFSIIACLSVAKALPIPIPQPDIVTVEDISHTTTYVPVAEVLISNGITTTIELTTIAPTTSPIPSAGTYTLPDNEEATTIAPATTTATTSNAVTSAEIITSSAEGTSTTTHSTLSGLVSDAYTSSSSSNAYTTVSNLVSDKYETPSATPATTTVATTPAATTSDNGGVLDVIVSVDRVILVDAEGNPFTTSEALVTATLSSSATVSSEDSTTAAPATTSGAEDNTTTTSSSAVVETTSSASSSSESSATSTESSATSTESPATSTESSTTSTESPTTATTSTSSFSSSSSSSSSSSFSDFVTTWADGEVFYSSLPTTMVSQTNVAPIFAVTTTTLSNTADAATTQGTLPLVSSGGSLLLATLTENLPKDKAVAASMANPATVSVTNTQKPVTPTTIPTPVLSTSSTSATSSTSTSTSAEGLDMFTDNYDATTSSTSSTSSATSAAATSSSSGYLTKVPGTIVYSPYENDGGCKSYATVLSDLTLIKSKGITKLRVYGNDCNYLTTVLPISKLLGLEVNQGFWISDAGVDSIDDAVSDLITYISSGAASYSWEIFSFFTVGNEAIISGYCTVPELISKISQVKSQLRAAGYTGDVITSEPPVTFENNPELCTESEIDFVGINPHSYFDAYVTAAEAGTFVAGQIEIVKQYCGSKDIFVTETGYPHEGDTNGLNVPSDANQLLALQSIFDVVGTDVTILTTFDDYWKSPGQYNIEQHFGMIDLLPTIN